MRVYFEKPRTTVGWKGPINDLYLTSFAINDGWRIARANCCWISMIKVCRPPVSSGDRHTADLADLMSWVAIGDAPTESQVHRELAFGLSCRSDRKPAQTYHQSGD
ncbi:hypothetical protein ACNKHW_03580 [Shigella flexneri]